MKAKSLPWQNLTKMFESDQESNMTGSEFQYSLLEVLINQAQFSFDPNGVRNLHDFASSILSENFHLQIRPIKDLALQRMLDSLGKDLSNLMKTVAPDCKRMALVCRWQGEFRKCSDLFSISKTDDGFCCSFNTISLAEGFAKPSKLENNEETENYDYDNDIDTDYLYEYGNYDDDDIYEDEADLDINVENDISEKHENTEQTDHEFDEMEENNDIDYIDFDSWYGN